MLQHVRQQFSSSVIFLYTSSNESMLFLVLLHKFVTHMQPSSASFSGPGSISVELEISSCSAVLAIY